MLVLLFYTAMILLGLGICGILAEILGYFTK